MRGYLQTQSCRRRYLLAYFGAQPAELPEVCCDRCQPQALGGAQARAVPKPTRDGPRLRAPRPAPSAPAMESQLSRGGAPEADEPVLAELLRWRAQRAAAEGVADDAIATRQELQRIAAARPADMADLRRLGVLPAPKFALFAPEIVAAVATGRRTRKRAAPGSRRD